MLFGFVFSEASPHCPYMLLVLFICLFFFHDLLLPYVSALLSEASPKLLNPCLFLCVSWTSCSIQATHCCPRRAPCNIHLVAQLIVSTHKKRCTKLNDAAYIYIYMASANDAHAHCHLNASSFFFLFLNDMWWRPLRCFLLWCSFRWSSRFSRWLKREHRHWTK